MAQLTSSTVTGDLHVTGEIHSPPSEDGQKAGVLYVKYQNGILYISTTPITTT
jgi:hypothetical protein